MHGSWASDSFQAHLLSLPFALAPTAMLIVISFAAVMRGAPLLRGWMLAHCLSLLPYAMIMTLSPSIVDPDTAFALFQISIASIPLAAATGVAFQLTLLRQYARYRAWILLGVASAAVWLVISPTTRWVIVDVQRIGDRLWFPTAGPGAAVAIAHTVLLSVPGFASLGWIAWKSRPSHERRQLRLVLLANVVTYAGLVDVGLAYGLGVFPLGWLLSGIGSLLVVRALVVDDLLRVRAVDTTAPLLVLHGAIALFLGWIVVEQLGPQTPWWVIAVALCTCFGAVRASVATVGLLARGGRGGAGPLDRLLAQLVTRARGTTDPLAIADLATDIVELGVGTRPQILLATSERGWMTGAGVPITGAHAPEPRIASWLAAQSGAVFANDLDKVPAELREPVDALFDQLSASAVVPVASAHELIALAVLSGERRVLRGRALAFVERASERLAEALLHARMAQRASERASLAREVELAATVQAELLPGQGSHVHGDVTVVGSWRPATRCAGDFWGVYPLGDDRVLVTIGDVTGHGVAAAMVTAAAVGACEVSARAGGRELDLRQLVAALDAAVRRVGGGELLMTCFAAILDPRAGEIRFVSCGHTAPYLCRAGDTRVELRALVGRGNPLGHDLPAAPKLHQRSLHRGDLLVWYTDGVIEAQDPAGEPFGDRKLQHLLRRLEGGQLSPRVVHDVVEAAVTSHRASQPLADDQTLVVAQVTGS